MHWTEHESERWSWDGSASGVSSNTPPLSDDVSIVCPCPTHETWNTCSMGVFCFMMETWNGCASYTSGSERDNVSGVGRTVNGTDTRETRDTPLSMHSPVHCVSPDPESVISRLVNADDGDNVSRENNITSTDPSLTLRCVHCVRSRPLTSTDGVRETVASEWAWSGARDTWTLLDVTTDTDGMRRGTVKTPAPQLTRHDIVASPVSGSA